MMIVSLKSGNADSRADIIILRPSTDEIVLRGLRTRKDRRTDRFIAPPAKSEKKAENTIVKSRIFHESLR